jgi:hypothetical protein
MWNDYVVPSGTYRENLLGTPGHPGVPDGHPAAQYKYAALKKKYGAQENGDIIIDRRTPAFSETLAKVAPPVMEQKTNGVSASVAEIKVGA